MNLLEKRKAVDSLVKSHNKPTKQPRLDAFFLPARAAGTTTAQASPGLTPNSADKTVTSPTKSRFEPGPRLSDEQESALRMVVEEGKSVFFTGSAGTSGPPPAKCPFYTICTDFGKFGEISHLLNF